MKIALVFLIGICIGIVIGGVLASSQQAPLPVVDPRCVAYNGTGAALETPSSSLPKCL